jgi:tetratricopeptide (TPR) repeat protein
LPDESPERAFYLADLALQEALFKIKFGDYLSGLYLLLQANSQIAEIQDRNDQILPFLKPAGVINILIGLTPQKYEWAVRLIGLRGDLEKGKQKLASLARSTSPLSSEALILLGYFYAYPLQMPDDAARCFSSVLATQPRNVPAAFMLATSLNKAHKGGAALEVMDAQSTNAWSGFPQAYYLMGTLLLQKGDYAPARQFLHQFMQTYAGSSFKKDAATKIAMSYYLEGEIEKGETWKQNALTAGNTGSEPDKNAEVMLAEISEYPTQLLRARLLTDGGYWDEAQQQLATTGDTRQLDDRWACEYHYRLARLFQLQQQQEPAVASYAEALKLADNKNWYIGASSALQAGLILKARGNSIGAVDLFKKAKTFDGHPYKASIDMQADRELASLSSN